MRAVVLTALSVLLFACVARPDQRPVHDKAFWRAIAENNGRVPPGESLPDLISELSGYLASPDPELRDDIAYSRLTQWVYRQRVVPVELRRTLLVEWTANLKTGLGERGTDSVFGRSYSALALGLLVMGDNERTPFLEKAEFDRLLSAAVWYLRGEQDMRGFDDEKGRIHSVSHAADLLKFLGRSRHLSVGQQALILRAIGDKMAVVPDVFTHGEDERLAQAIRSVIMRKDFDVEAFRDWVPALRPVRTSGEQRSATLSTARNQRNLTRALYILLSSDPGDLPTIAEAAQIVRQFMLSDFWPG